VVTGAGRGIGLAAAAALADAGAEVVLVARTGAEVAAAAGAIRRAGGRADAAVLDVTDAQAVARFFADIGPTQVLVDNAGMYRSIRMFDTSDDDLDAVIDLNGKAAWCVAREWSRQLLAAEQAGSLINISSQMGHVGGPKRTVYCASK